MRWNVGNKMWKDVIKYEKDVIKCQGINMRKMWKDVKNKMKDDRNPGQMLEKC